MDMFKKSCILAKNMIFVSSLMFKFVKCELKKLSNIFHTDG